MDFILSLLFIIMFVAVAYFVSLSIHQNAHEYYDKLEDTDKGEEVVDENFRR